MDQAIKDLHRDWLREFNKPQRELNDAKRDFRQSGA